MGKKAHSCNVGGSGKVAALCRSRVVATFSPGIFGVEAMPQFVQLGSWYPSLEGGLLKDSIRHVFSIS